MPSLRQNQGKGVKMKRYLQLAVLNSLVIAIIWTGNFNYAFLGRFLICMIGFMIYYFFSTRGADRINRYIMKKRWFDEEQIKRCTELNKRGYSILKAMRIARTETPTEKINRDNKYRLHHNFVKQMTR